MPQSSHVVHLPYASYKLYFPSFSLAVGSCVNLLIHPTGALLIGTFAGLLSVLGYRYLSVKFLFFNYFYFLLQLIFLLLLFHYQLDLWPWFGV